MAYNYEYPYTDVSRVNSDWIIKRVLDLSKEFNDFVIKNQIKYHDPIQWNITTQYEQYEVVTNENKAYMSKEPIATGTPITDSKWLLIADYGTLYESIKHSIAYEDDKDSTTTTKDRTTGELLWLSDVLYKVVRDMNVGDAYVKTGVNPNVIGITVEELIDDIGDLIGDIEPRVEYLEEHTKKPYLDAVEYGLKGDGTDMTDVLNDIIETYADEYAIYIKKGDYTFDDTIIVDKFNTIIKCDGTLYCNGAIGVLVKASDCIIDINRILGDETNVGFQHGHVGMTESYGNSDIRINYIWECDTGIKLYAEGNNGIQNDTIHFIRIDSCANGIVFECGDTGDPWINQNFVYGGWIFAGSSLPNAKGVLFIKGTGQTDKFNNNCFYSLSCENTRYPIELDYALNNVFRDMRLFENTGSDLIKCSSTTDSNYFEGAMNYVDYESITDNGYMNEYIMNFYHGAGINVCDRAFFTGGTFCPSGQYFLPKTKIYDRGSAGDLWDWYETIVFDGSDYNVGLILPPKYTKLATANSFILVTGALSGTGNIVTYNGTEIISTETTDTTSGILMKANSMYLIVPYADNNYKAYAIKEPISDNMSLGDLSDVYIEGTPSHGQHLIYNADLPTPSWWNETV